MGQKRTLGNACFEARTSALRVGSKRLNIHLNGGLFRAWPNRQNRAWHTAVLRGTSYVRYPHTVIFKPQRRAFIALKPGPKPIAESTGKPDQRRRDNKTTPGNTTFGSSPIIRSNAANLIHLKSTFNSSMTAL